MVTMMIYALRIVNRAVMRAAAVLCALALVIGNSSFLLAQQPQAPANAPLYSVNAKYVNGLAPGYWPVAANGLTLILSSGTAYCGNPPSAVPFTGGTMTMNPSATNYVYLNPAANCAPTVNTTGFAAGYIPIAKVVAGASSITSVTDLRTWSSPNPAAVSSSGAVQIAALGSNQDIALTPSGTGASVITNLADRGGQVYNVKAYGAKGDGSTDDTAAIQSAVAAIRVPTGLTPGTGAKYTANGVIYFPPGTYKVSQLDLTDTFGLTIEGSGGKASVIKCSETSPGSGICLDLAGSVNSRLTGFSIVDGTNGPEAEILVGKTTQNSNANYNYFHIQMSPTTATYGLYNYGSEELTIVDPVFWASNNSIPVVISSLNTAGVASAFSTLATGGQSMTNVTFLGGRIVGAGAENVFIDDYNGSAFKAIENVSFFGTYFGLAGPSTIGITDPPGTPAGATDSNFNIIGSRFEFDGGPNNQAVKMNVNGVSNWTIFATFGCATTPATYAFYFGGHFKFSRATIYGNDTSLDYAGGSFYANTDEGSLIQASNTINAPGAINSLGAIDTVRGYTNMSRYYLPGASNQYITGGGAAPTGACQTGSMYLNTNGGAGTTLYICESGAWAAK